MKLLLILLSILCFSVAIYSNAYSDAIASRLFGDLKRQVFQIRVIDLASGDKSSIGSGFLVSADGWMATNFHVVASYVHQPTKHRLEGVYHDGTIVAVELLGIDVIHDLAIVKLATPTEHFFRLSSDVLSKGDRIYSMGNPHDLGMTIIEGNYNGLIKTSRYKKILFSGSLNAGMSGGPAIDGQGRIIGVNVSTGGEQLSFLVPANELRALLHKVEAQGKTDNFDEEIKVSLLRDQEAFYGHLLAEQWRMNPFGELMLPNQISESLKCWGHTVSEEESRYKGVHQHCYSQDEIYINQHLYTGTFSYAYEWLTTHELNRFQFYDLMEGRFSHASPANISKQEDATNYECYTDFVTIDQHSWRTSACIRAYKKYAGLYDTLLLLVSVDMNQKGIIIKAGATGVSRDNASLLMRKVMESIEWKR